jgi:transcriptional regulator with XRE-family HTH domain
MKKMKNSRKTIFNAKYRRLVSNLAALRKANGMTQRDLAAALGVSHCYVARTEIFERRLDIIDLMSFMKALRIPKAEAVAILSEVF